MRLSTDRILTTHVGSLPRPPDLLALLEAREHGREFDQTAFDTVLAAAVRETVAKQVTAGIDSICDGEMSKISYTFYVRHRLSGITALRGVDNEQPPQTAAHRDLLDHPDYMHRYNQMRGGTSWYSREAVPCCTGPVAYRDRRPVETDLDNLAAACRAVNPGEAFMNAASPGVLTTARGLAQLSGPPFLMPMAFWVPLVGIGPTGVALASTFQSVGQRWPLLTVNGKPEVWR